VLVLVGAVLLATPASGATVERRPTGYLEICVRTEVREHPRPDSRAVYTLYVGNNANVFDYRGGWAKTNYPARGWFLASALCQ